MGVTVQTIYKWEKGTTEPKASQVSKLASVLKLSEREICQGQKDDPSLMKWSLSDASVFL